MIDNTEHGNFESFLPKIFRQHINIVKIQVQFSTKSTVVSIEIVLG